MDRKGQEGISSQSKVLIHIKHMFFLDLALQA